MAVNISKVARSRPDTTAVVTPPRVAASRNASRPPGNGPGLQGVSDERSERAVEVDSHEDPRPGSEGGERATQFLAHLAQLPIRSEALSDARRLARLARSTPRSSRVLARVKRCGLDGADASASR